MPAFARGAHRFQVDLGLVQINPNHAHLQLIADLKTLPGAFSRQPVPDRVEMEVILPLTLLDG